MQKFRKKFIVEAVQFTGENSEEIIKWGKECISPLTENALDVLTMLDEHVAIVGDWIIKNDEGYFFIKSNDKFKKDYEAA
jgi:hypothetical protein